MKPGEIMAFWRSIVCVSAGSKVLGMISPSEEMVRGWEKSFPEMHWRQLMN